MSRASIKIPYAEKNGRLIHVSQVESGLKCKCVCPVCKKAVIARKGRVMTHHFAHHGRRECSPETVLHQVGKRLLHERISRHLKRKQPLTLQWECLYCSETHEGNLTKLAHKAELEKNLDTCRPDIVLSDKNGKPLAVLEVVVTHQPDENVFEYCEREGAALVCFRIQNTRDLLALGFESPLRPDRVELCMKPQCEVCKQVLSPATMHVIDITCWRCGLSMKAAVIKAGENIMGPEAFTSGQKKIAEESGVYISHSYSHTSHKRYMANTCPSCSAFTGAPYLRLYSSLIRNTEGREVGSICIDCMRELKSEGELAENAESEALERQ